MGCVGDDEMKMTAACRFCGQVRGVIAGDDVTDDALEYLATMNCDCDAAKGFQLVEMKKRYAQANIEKILADDGDTVKEICLGLTDALARQTITQVAMTTQHGIKIKMIGKEKRIKIERTETIKEAAED